MRQAVNGPGFDAGDPGMSHAEFVGAWREGRIAVAIDAGAAAAFLSARLLLPFVAIAVIGAGIALALSGSIWTGLAVGALGIAVPRLIKRGARRFLLSQIATDAGLYGAGVAAGVIRIVPTDEPGHTA
jgi:hypothetical protein